MKQAFLVAGTALFALVATPAIAKPGHGNGHGNRQDQRYGDRDNDRRYGDNDRGYDRNCPPGLAKKHNGCQSPGQARKLARGQRWSSGYGSAYGYNQIPYDLRQRYDLDPNNRYYYDQGTLYGVDRRTGLIEAVLSALLR